MNFYEIVEEMLFEKYKIKFLPEFLKKPLEAIDICLPIEEKKILKSACAWMIMRLED